jgi:uncharacterized membrane protein YhaH (DUF805 family)
LNDLPRDTHLRVLSAIIGVVALPLLMMLVLSPLAIARAPAERVFRRRSAHELHILPIAFVLGLYGVFLAITARRLWKRQKRAGWWALVACVTWMPTGLMPLGVYGLYALLRSKEVRDAWV